MESLMGLLEMEEKKRMIFDALGSLFPNVGPDQYGVITEKMHAKMTSLNELVNEIAKERTDQVHKVAVESEISNEAVLGCFLHFVLVLENVLLGEMVQFQQELITQMLEGEPNEDDNEDPQ